MAGIRIAGLEEATSLSDNMVLATDGPEGTKKISVGQLLSNVTLTGEASGAIASFSDAIDASMKSCTVSIEPVQDLHGYDRPWAGGAGKNKFDEVWKENYFVDKTGYHVNTDYKASENYIKLVGGETYKIVASSNYTVYVNKYNSEKTYLGTNYQNVLTNTTFTLDSEVSFITFFVENVNDTNGFMIIANGESDSYSPYSNICPITGNDEVTTYVRGFNLWDEEWEVGTIATSNGQNATDNTRIRTKGYIEVTPTETYYLKCPVNDGRGLFYDVNKNYIGNSSTMFTLGTFTVPDNCHYIRFSPISSYGTVYNHDICVNISKESGSPKNGNYVPYNPNSADYTTDLGTTVYGGTLDLVSGVLAVDRASVDLGTLNFSKLAAQNGNAFTALVSDAKFWDNVSDTHILCSEFPEDKSKTNAYYIANNTCKMGGSYFGGRNFTVVTDMYNSATDFKTAMDGAQLVYKLATPYTVQLTPTQVRSLLGFNNVWSDSGEMASVVYVRDINAVIGDILQRLEALEPSRSAKSVEAPAEEEKPEEAPEEK